MKQLHLNVCPKDILQSQNPPTNWKTSTDQDNSVTPTVTFQESIQNTLFFLKLGEVTDFPGGWLFRELVFFAKYLRPKPEEAN
ncbi:hypothetical protein CEXT_754731 [Caerostris extrusa]|uniref:Ycf15 n=1 Tax=Caerostris extrusa TaxID=172846 RepID=A0AAV4ME09_CAEEX|nr:hypothetical protein CEXT_754731 [Caerostris extrusa]